MTCLQIKFVSSEKTEIKNGMQERNTILALSQFANNFINEIQNKHVLMWIQFY